MPRFATTRWSMVLAAGKAPAGEADLALARLCEVYWHPLYSFVRRQGHDAEDARDLTQEFFARLLEKQYLNAANPERGRFRSFLLAALRHFLANEWDRTRALKRGAGKVPLSLDFDAAERHDTLEPVDNETPELVFERQWALALLEHVMAELGRECEATGKQERFARLKVYVMEGHDDSSYRDAAADLGLSEGAVKVAVHRLRRRFGELLRDAVAQTVADPRDIDDELRYLIESLGR